MARSGSVRCFRVIFCFVSLIGAALAMAPVTGGAFSDEVFAGDAEPRARAISGPPTFLLGLPEQPLVRALDAFGEATATELFYDSAAIAKRRSAPVHGRFTAAEALTRLVSGTDLMIRRIGASSFTIEQPTTHAVSSTSDRPDVGRHAGYFALLQHRLEVAMCDQGRSVAPQHRVVIRLRIAVSGQVAQLELFGPQGVLPDGATLAFLSRINAVPPPPADLPQPLVLLITPSAEPVCRI